MPLPFFVPALLKVVAGYGVLKGAKGMYDLQRARSMAERAEDIYNAAKAELESARSATTAKLEQLGRMRLEAWDRQLGRFVSLSRQINPVRITGRAAREFQLFNITPHEFEEMEKGSDDAAKILAGGAADLGTGALVGVASYGAVAAFGIASTGTPIGLLSGAAATKATLAWFGGGSLATGGLGISGGVAVLGGLTAAPVLAVGGFLLDERGKQSLETARQNLGEAQKAAAEMEKATTVVRRIGEVADRYVTFIQELDGRMTETLDRLEEIITVRRMDASWWRRVVLRGRSAVKYDDLSDEEKETVRLAGRYAEAMKKLLETPLLTENGGFNEGSEAVLEAAAALLPKELS